MADLEREIDRLYQLPLDEFTAARNALAKQAGARRQEIATLAKPNVAAWAVNQLYWRHRGDYEALIAAAEQVRHAHAQMLKGKAADVARAERAHTDAIRHATERIRGLLNEGGEAASPATLNAVGETLQSLPSEDAPGRLVRPLKPLGFEALTGLLIGSARPRAAPPVVPIARTAKTGAAAARARAADEKRAAAEAKRDEERRRKEAAALAERLREARAAERAAETALAKSRAELQRAERERERLETAIEAATADIDRLTDVIRDRERAVSQTAIARKTLELQQSQLP